VDTQIVSAVIISGHTNGWDVSDQMWEYKHSIEGKVSRNAVWGLYSDVATWSEWHAGIEWIKLDGDFRVGTSGKIKPKGQDRLPFRLTNVDIDGSFSDETEIPGAGVSIGFTHTLESVGEGLTRITHHVTISGPAADYLGPAIGPEMAEEIPDTMYALMRMAQLREGEAEECRI
jgi:Polyketide cyclase / dehydrase and lipid transport